MNKAEKVAVKAQLTSEEKALKELKTAYRKARKDVQEQIKLLNARDDLQNLQSIIYQRKYQEILLEQIDEALKDPKDNQYTTLDEFFNGSYVNGYVGSMYNFSSQGIPILMPVDPKKIERAIRTESKLSRNYYRRGDTPENISKLKKSVRMELSRGIAGGKTWIEMAYQVANGMNSPFKKALNDANRIIRTEGHRINQQGFLDAGDDAIESGADVVKQWDSTLDGFTRPWHREADGQIREWNDYFDDGGEKMKAPSIGGSARNVCNCRCQLLQRAKWAMDEKELQTLKERAQYFKLDKSDSFESFKQKYLNLPKDASRIKLDKKDIKSHTQKLKAGMKEEDYNEYMKILENHENESIKNLYIKYADNVHGVIYRKGNGRYYTGGGDILFDYPAKEYIDNGKPKFHIIAHEYGHFFDDSVEYEGLHFKEIELINERTGMTIFRNNASSSDEFLKAVRKDKEYLKSILTDEIKQKLKDSDASAGVQDAIDGLLWQRIKWGHGNGYYNRKYSVVKTLRKHKSLKNVYNELGMEVKTLKQTEDICRVYESASEMWANIMSAEVNGGSELEFIKKFLPNSYEMFIKILKGVK